MKHNTREVEVSRKEYGLLFGAVLNYDQQLMESIWDWHTHQLQKAREEGFEAGMLVAEEQHTGRVIHSELDQDKN